jgi:hypothetical protein
MQRLESASRVVSTSQVKPRIANNTENWGKHGAGSLPKAFGQSMPCWHLDFGPLTSRAVREKTSAVRRWSSLWCSNPFSLAIFLSVVSVTYSQLYMKIVHEKIPRINNLPSMMKSWAILLNQFVPHLGYKSFLFPLYTHCILYQPSSHLAAVSVILTAAVVL